jgi:phosphohistidine phosphatase
VSDLYLVRHAVAFDRDPEQWPDDRLRPLTPDGIRKFQKAARGLRRAAGSVDRVLASPLTRARQTAEILSEAGGWPAAVECPELAPGVAPASLVALLRKQDAGAIALVGHEPGLGILLAYLVGGPNAPLHFEMKKGAVARLSFTGAVQPGKASLRWMLTQRMLRGLR